ncbi:hypothetical protein NKH18_40395 [Streptomyces sp. M10(2022)]
MTKQKGRKHRRVNRTPRPVGPSGTGRAGRDPRPVPGDEREPDLDRILEGWATRSGKCPLSEVRPARSADLSRQDRSSSTRHVTAASATMRSAPGIS